MANSAKQRYAVSSKPIPTGKVIGYSLVLDTTGTDLLIHTPAEDASVFLKGMVGAETNAANLSFKQRSPELTGTVATTNTDATITGTGTSFTQDYAVGDEIVIQAGNTLVIDSITNDLSMEATTNATSTVSGKAHQKQQTLVTPEYAANQGVYSKVTDNGWDVATDTGYALVLNTSAAISSLLVNVQEGRD